MEKIFKTGGVWSASIDLARSNENAVYLVMFREWPSCRFMRIAWQIKENVFMSAPDGLKLLKENPSAKERAAIMVREYLKLKGIQL
jgi:hypothetical protein